MKRALLLMAVAAVIAAGGFAYGVAFGKYRVFPYRAVVELVRDVRGTKTVNKLAQPRTIASGLVDLDIEPIAAPADAITGPGGGVAARGTEVLVTTRRGQVMVARDGRMRMIDVALPDNGYDDYVTKAETIYASYRNRYQWLRYNDLLFFGDGETERLAVSYVNWDPARDCYAAVVAVATLPAGLETLNDLSLAASDWSKVYESTPCLPLTPQYGLDGHMTGGRLTDMGDGKVGLSTGQVHVPDFDREDDDYGRVVVIDGKGGAAARLGIGLRNPLGIVRDSQGRVWTVENGPQGGDELNLIRTDADYGWPLVSLGLEPLPQVKLTGAPGRHEDYELPVLAWVPSIAPSNLIEVRDFHPAWRGDLLIGTLRAQSLVRVRLEGERVLYAETIRVGERVRDLDEMGDGRLALWTDSGRLLIVTARSRPDEGQILADALGAAGLDDDTRKSVEQIVGFCTECHNVQPGLSRNAPTLAGVVGREVASADYPYSEALRKLSGTWSRDRLKQFLREPEAMAPGTAMPAVGDLEENVLDGLIDTLGALPAS